MKTANGGTKIDADYMPDSHIVYHEGDTLNYLKTLPDGLVKLIISSPPYNVGKKYETKTSIEKYLETQKKVISELVRVLSPEGSICWEVGNFIHKGEVFPLDIFYYQIFKDFGLQLRNRIIWHYGHGLHCQKRFSGRYETILCFSKTDNYTFNLDPVRVPSKYPGKRYHRGEKKGQPAGNPLGKNPSDVWEFGQTEWELGLWDIPNVKSNHPEKTLHQCQYPIELVERCLLALTNEGDWVLDPYAGVGSALVAAVKNQRRAMGAEKEPTYVKIGKQRIDDFFNGKLKYRKLGTPVHVPIGTEAVAKVPEEWRHKVKLSHYCEILDSYVEQSEPIKNSHSESIRAGK